MRIHELELVAFGPFTDVVLDLSGGDRGLHVVYGSNEAGKSTALRALRALLFGIPNRTADDFVHKKNQLRVGARIIDEEGRELRFVRRKGAKNTLLDGDGEPVPESALTALLGGLQEDLFTSLFGIDHSGLVRGRQDLLAGEGEVGASLFAAATGGAGLRQVLQDLESEMDALFKARGQNQVVNRAIGELAKARKRVRERSLPAAEWTERREALDDARREKDRVTRDIQRLRGEESRWIRFQRGVPLAGRREKLLRELADLAEIPLLRSSFSEDRRQATLESRAALQSAEALESELEAIHRELRETEVPGELLEHGEMITDLYKRLGSHLQARNDLGPLEQRSAELRAEAGILLRGLRPGAELEEVDSLRLSEERKNRIRHLATEYAGLLKEVDSRRADLEGLEGDLEGARRRLRRAEEPADSGILRHLVQSVPKDLEEQLESAAKEEEAAEEEARVESTKLNFWSGALEELEALRVPSEETVDSYEGRLGRLDALVEALSKEAAGCEKEAAGLELELDELQLAGSVPSEEELDGARRHRDEGWRLVRRAWLDGEVDSPAARQYAGERPLWRAYEESVGRADDLSDRLRREAGQVATRASLVARLERARKRLRELDAQLRAAEEGRAAILEAWREEWRALCEEPLSPREMRSWLQRQSGLLRCAKDIRARRLHVGDLTRRIERCREDLTAALEAVGESAGSPGESLPALLGRCASRIEALERSRRERERLDDEVRSNEDALAKARERLEGLRERLAAMREEWRGDMDSLGLPAETTPEEAHAVLGKLSDLFSRIDEAAAIRSRTDAIERAMAVFHADVARFVKRVSPDLARLPAAEAVEKLHARWSEAKKNAALRERLVASRATKQSLLREARREADDAGKRLTALCEEAASPDVEELQVREELSDRRRSLEQELADIEARLLEEAGGDDLDGFLSELAEINADELPGLLEALGRQIADREAALSESDRRIGTEETELKLMDGRGDAAEAAEEVQSLLARIRGGVEHYARLKLASALLRREIESYRERNQAPLLERSGRLFERLTAGSFAGLRAELDDRNRPVLEGVRASGETVRVEGMSDGTRDQLYLSLRLAALERHLELHPPLPVIIDDLLINFDGRRSRATLEVLADLSSRTQVIFFTHHDHLVELARQVVPPEVLQVPSFRFRGESAEEAVAEAVDALQG